MPTPPVEINDPVVVVVDAVVDVTAKPEIVNISVDGLYTKLLSVETAAPEADPEAGVNKTL